MELFPTEWIDRIIGINSETERSNADVVAFLRPLMLQAGLQVEEQKVVENGETFINLIGYNQRLDHPDLLLFNTHLDTVSGGDLSLWTKTGNNPFKATWVRDRVYGLGTADVKIDFLCKLWAIRQAGPLQRPIALVGTYGEERGLVGVQKLFKEKKLRPKYAMVGEPSNLELIYAHKGHLIGIARLPIEKSNDPGRSKTWKGKAAHSSTPALGINALSKAFVEILRRKQGIVHLEAGVNTNRVPESATARTLPTAGTATKELFKYILSVESLAKTLSKKSDTRFSPSRTTMSWNLCRTTDGHVELAFDYRLIPGIDPFKVKKQVEKLLPRSGSWVQLDCDLPLAGEKHSPLMEAASQALKKCGVKAARKTKASSTEAAVYHHHGVQAIVFGPGISVNNVHKPNEHNLLSQIRTATRFYYELLKLPGGF